MMDEILTILQDLHPDVDFESCDTLIDDGILDSFDIVTIIAEISDAYDVKIGAEQIVPENFNSAEALWDLVRRLEEDE